MRSHPVRAGALLIAVAALGAGCAARAVPPAAPRGVAPPRVASPPAAAPVAPPPVARPPADLPAGLPALLTTALGLIGAPYRAGGSDPAGFDCSGFVQYVFGRHGWRVPRTVGAQFAATEAVSAEAVRAGDLLFFATSGGGPSHVAIALGDGRFVHAPSGRGQVRVEALAGRYWVSRWIGARRVAGLD